MKPLAVMVFVLTASIFQSGCGGSENSEMTPEQLHKACIAVFERKGGPPEMGRAMCDSMKKACERDPTGEDCEKAQRMVRKG